jgi:hypothetical protein
MATATDASTNSNTATTTFTVVPGPSFLVSVTPTTVKRGGKVIATKAFTNCASTSQRVTLKVRLVSPVCDIPMVTLPVTLQAGQRGSFSITLTIPKPTLLGLYALTLDWYVGGVKVGTSTAQLTVTS